MFRKELTDFVGSATKMCLGVRYLVPSFSTLSMLTPDINFNKLQVPRERVTVQLFLKIIIFTTSLI